MAKTKISEYDSTAANNTDIDGINIAEGMSPSNVNNALREQMAHLKDGLGAGTPVFLDQTNNRVGIGTSSPDRSLHIAGNPAQIIIEDTGGGTDDKRAALFTDSGVFEIGSKNDDDSTRVNDIFCADLGTGNVGIGTNNPQYGRLHIFDDNSDIAMDANGSGQLHIDGNGYTFGLALNASGAQLYTNSANRDIIFGVNETEIMRVTDGNVGIGTSSPQTTLHVRKDDTAVVGLKLQNNTTNGIMEYQVGNDADNWFFGIDASDRFGISDVTGQASQKLVITQSGNVGINESSPDRHLHVNGGTENVVAKFESTDTACSVEFIDSTGLVTLETRNDFRFKTGADIDMMIDTSGNLLVGTTVIPNTLAGASATQGVAVNGSTGYLVAAASGTATAYFNRQSSDGDIAEFRFNGTTCGTILSRSGVVISMVLDARSGGMGISGSQASLLPTDNAGTPIDNSKDLGSSSVRWDDVRATNGTIQTSDENEKQQIASLTDAEMTAAKAISKLFKTFKWNDKVEAKGDAARTHTGVIAQQVEQAMTDAGLTASNYAFWCSDTWWETQTDVPAVEAVEAQDAVYEDVIIPAVEEVLDEEGNVVTEAQPERTEQRLVSEAVEGVEGKEAYTRTDTYNTLEEAPEVATERNRKGIRYPELLSFIGAATEQRLTSVEARLDALEG